MSYMCILPSAKPIIPQSSERKTGPLQALEQTMGVNFEDRLVRVGV